MIFTAMVVGQGRVMTPALHLYMLNNELSVDEDGFVLRISLRSHQHFALSNISKADSQKDDKDTAIRYYVTTCELPSNFRQNSKRIQILLQSEPF